MVGMDRYDSEDAGSPMHTASSASCTWRQSSSAVEYTATVFSPNSLHALMTRTAISPLLAMSTFVMDALGATCSLTTDAAGRRDATAALDAAPTHWDEVRLSPPDSDRRAARASRWAPGSADTTRQWTCVCGSKRADGQTSVRYAWDTRAIRVGYAWDVRPMCTCIRERRRRRARPGRRFSLVTSCQRGMDEGASLPARRWDQCVTRDTMPRYPACHPRLNLNV